MVINTIALPKNSKLKVLTLWPQSQKYCSPWSVVDEGCMLPFKLSICFNLKIIVTYYRIKYFQFCDCQNGVNYVIFKSYNQLQQDLYLNNAPAMFLNCRSCSRRYFVYVVTDWDSLCESMYRLEITGAPLCPVLYTCFV